jgi:hypothetical protein
VALLNPGMNFGVSAVRSAALTPKFILQISNTPLLLSLSLFAMLLRRRGYAFKALFVMGVAVAKSRSQSCKSYY